MNEFLYDLPMYYSTSVIELQIWKL